MRITYDGKIYSLQTAGGINRYFAEIISRLPAEWNPLLYGARELGRTPPRHPRLIIDGGPWYRSRRICGFVRGATWVRYLAKANGLFHPTYYFLSDGLTYKKVCCPMVLTVQDLSYATYVEITEDAACVIRAERELQAPDFARGSGGWMKITRIERANWRYD